jgi:hypothetical protein
MLIKLDDQQLGWMAADRARVIAVGSRDPLISAEAARNLAVLARKAGWHAQATSIALTAAASPGLRGRTAAGGAARAALRHLPSGYPRVNTAWMWGLCSRPAWPPGCTS